MIFELDYIYEYELESHAFKESSAQWFEDNSNIKKYRAAVNPYATTVKKQLLINFIFTVLIQIQVHNFLVF